MSGCSWRLKLGGRGLGSYWHAAKLRLTHVFFPLGFIALVRAGSPDPPVLCDRGSPSPRSLAHDLETSGRPNGGVGRPSPNEPPRLFHDPREIETSVQWPEKPPRLFHYSHGN